MTPTIGFWYHTSGILNLTIQLFPVTGGPSLNGSGTDLTEEGSTTLYLAVIPDMPKGEFRANILRGTAVVYQGTVFVRGAGRYIVDAPDTGSPAADEGGISSLDEIQPRGLPTVENLKTLINCLTVEIYNKSIGRRDPKLYREADAVGFTIEHLSLAELIQAQKHFIAQLSAVENDDLDILPVVWDNPHI